MCRYLKLSARDFKELADEAARELFGRLIGCAGISEKPREFLNEPSSSQRWQGCARLNMVSQRCVKGGVQFIANGRCTG